MVSQPYLPSGERQLTTTLSGHGQSGQFLSCKTRFLQHPLRQMILRTLHQKSAYSNVDKVEFYYPSGPLPANPDHPWGESNNLWAWGHGDPKLDHISGLKQSIQYIMWILETHGPFVGTMGFSTGAAIAAMVCSLLEKRRSLADFDIDVRSHCNTVLCDTGLVTNFMSYLDSFSSSHGVRSVLQRI